MSFFALKGFEKLQFLLQQNPFPPGKNKNCKLFTVIVYSHPISHMHRLSQVIVTVSRCHSESIVQVLEP